MGGFALTAAGRDVCGFTARTGGDSSSDRDIGGDGGKLWELWSCGDGEEAAVRVGSAESIQ